MDRIVKFTILGAEFEAIVSGAADEQEAREVATTQIAKAIHNTFRIKSITSDPNNKRRKSLFDTYRDGFAICKN